jgi:hypothetical protein
VDEGERLAQPGAVDDPFAGLGVKDGGVAGRGQQVADAQLDADGTGTGSALGPDRGDAGQLLLDRERGVDDVLPRLGVPRDGQARLGEIDLVVGQGLDVLALVDRVVGAVDGER